MTGVAIALAGAVVAVAAPPVGAQRAKAAETARYQCKLGVPPFVDNTGSGGEQVGTTVGRAVQAELTHSTSLIGRVLKLEEGVNSEDVDGEKAIEIARNYINTFTSRGGVKVYEDVGSGGGTGVARMPAAGKNIWLQVDINNSGEMYTLHVVDEAAMEQKVEYTAMELAKALNEKGSVAVHGIFFDTGKATIKPESAAAVAPIGDLLKSDASLKLEIQGHTDNVGAAAANLKLSQDWAAAVKAYLVSTFGVAATRLTTAGLGDTKPVGDTKTEAGRAENRRVELVKK